MAKDQIATTGDPADFICISPEMTIVMGPDAAMAPLPPRAVALVASFGAGLCSLRIDPKPVVREMLASADPTRLILLIKREAVLRLGGATILSGEAGSYHLPAELRAIALAVRNTPSPWEARSTYQSAKSIEFLCEAIRQFTAGELAPLAGEGHLSAADTRRVLAARQMIEERSAEKLTLDLIARACGLNRSKLTRGFKDLFNCTVAEAIAERRLDLARRMLLTTDKPVSSIGYESGYLNNASFARAFGRRFGHSPSHFRTQGLAA